MCRLTKGSMQNIVKGKCIAEKKKKNSHGATKPQSHVLETHNEERLCLT